MEKIRVVSVTDDNYAHISYPLGLIVIPIIYKQLRCTLKTLVDPFYPGYLKHILDNKRGL